MQAQKVSTANTLSAKDAIAKARQGDIQALQHLMESPLKSKDVRVRVKRRDSSLAISLMGKKALSKKSYLGYVTRGLQKLSLEDCETVRVSAYQMGKFNPLWQENLDLGSKQDPNNRKGQMGREHSSNTHSSNVHNGREQGSNEHIASQHHNLRRSAIASQSTPSKERVIQPISNRLDSPLHSSSLRTSPRRNVYRSGVAHSSSTRSGQAVQHSRSRLSRSVHTTPNRIQKGNTKRGNGAWLISGLLLTALSLLGLIGFGLLMRNAADTPVPNSADATATPNSANDSTQSVLEAES